jgi:FtsH-binding integral membrane protein
MTELTDNSSESLVRFSRRSMGTMLVIALVFGATALAMTLWPEGAASRFMAQASWVVPIAIVILVVALRATLRGRRWDPRSPETKAILNDELRQTSLNRSSRAALIVVLVAQLPLGLLFGMLAQLPATTAALAMAEATITLGMATLISLFLFFDRE